MTISVRDACIADVEPLLALIARHAEYERASASVTAPALARLIDDPQAPMHVFVATHDDDLAGYAALGFDYGLWDGAWHAHLDCLFVRADRRGHRIGKLLLAHAVDVARRAGAARIEWQTPAWNTDAVRFYEREGAQGLAKMRFSLPLSVGI